MICRFNFTIDCEREIHSIDNSIVFKTVHNFYENYLKMARKGKGAKNVPDSEFSKLRCPYTCLRAVLGTISMILFLVCLHSLIYDSFIAFNSPDCSKCDKLKPSKDCKAFCGAPIEDFVYITDTKDRNKVLVYFGVSLLLRCIAFMAAFIGVFVYIFYALVLYLVIHLGLELLFIGTLIFHASKGLSYNWIQIFNN